MRRASHSALLLGWFLLASPASTGAFAQSVEELLEELAEDERAQEAREQQVQDPADEPAPVDEPWDEGLDELLGSGVPEGGADESSPLSGWKGFFALTPRVYLRDRDRGKNDEQLLLEAEFELDFRFRSDLSGYFRPRIFVDALDGDLKRFEPYEAYLTFEAERWDLRAGQFVENWGIVDTFNPIDVVNRRDFATDFLDPDRLGELGVRYRRFLTGGETLGEPTLSFYALPAFRETRFPTEDNRFSFDTEQARFEEEAGFEPSGPERALYAARFQSTLDTRPFNADVQLTVARGPERFPSLQAQSLAGLQRLVPVYFGAETVGAGLRAVPNEAALGAFLASLTLKAEIVYKNPYAFDDAPLPQPDDYLAYVFGFDRSFYDVLRGQDQLTLTLEYAGESGADDPTSVLRPFRDDVIVRGLWEANDFARRSVEMRGIYDLETSETIFESIFETQLRSIHEDLKLRLQLQVFDPPETGESLFDFFPNNTALAVGLRWDF